MSEIDVKRLLGERIKSARATFPAMTPELVASFLEITPSQFADLEAGHTPPSADQIMLMADLMGVRPSWFFGGLDAVTKAAAHR